MKISKHIAEHYKWGGEKMIRPVMKEDLPQIVPLMLSYIVDFYKRPNPGETAVRKLVQRLLDHPDHGIQFIAEEEGTILGFATLYFTFSTLQVKRAAILNDLFVHADARGRKIGGSLFKHCLQYIRDHSFAYMQWETAKDNHVAQALYNKMGGHVSDWLVYEIK